MSLPAFPRGCREPVKYDKRLADRTEKDLFETGRKRRKFVRNDKIEDYDSEDEDRTIAQRGGMDYVYFGPLMPEMLSGGLLVLGCVDQIREYDMTVSLPNGLTGIVSITDVSQPYSRALQAHADNPDDTDATSAPSPLRAIFSVGRYVMCSVKKVEEDVVGTGRKTGRMTNLSVDPKVVNVGLTQSALYHGMLICAAVISEEDHGYAMDTGISGAPPAFLRRNKALKYQVALNQNRSLVVGQVLWCAIDMPEHNFEHGRLTSIQLTADPKEVSECRANEQNQGALLPGALIAGAVQVTDSKGLSVRALDQDTVVHRNHLENPLQSTKEYRLSQEVIGRLLYINPISAVLHLGLQNRLRQFYAHGEQFRGVSVWDIIPNATVEASSPYSVIFSFHKIKGAANKHGIPKEFVGDIETHYQVGTAHRCRVTEFRRIDDFVSVSLDPEILGKQVIVPRTLRAGDRVNVAVTQMHTRGLHVKLLNACELVYGFVPDILISDSGDNAWRHTIKPGHEMACQVLSKKEDDNFTYLTGKESILADGPPILSALDEASPNMLVRGWVIRHFPNALLISFNNNVKGVLRFPNTGQAELSTLADSYPCGKVVFCKILSVEPEASKIFLVLSTEYEVAECRNNGWKQKKLSTQKRKNIESQQLLADESPLMENTESDKPSKVEKVKKIATPVIKRKKPSKRDRIRKSQVRDSPKVTSTKRAKLGAETKMSEDSDEVERIPSLTTKPKERMKRRRNRKWKLQLTSPSKVKTPPAVQFSEKKKRSKSKDAEKAEKISFKAKKAGKEKEKKKAPDQRSPKSKKSKTLQESGAPILKHTRKNNTEDTSIKKKKKKLA